MKVDFHTHTRYSPDSKATIEAVLTTAHARGLDRLVITDHNCIKGALKAKKIDPGFVIVGEEIKTTAGEVLASFVKEEIPFGLDPFKTIDLLRQQNAFISLSHPMDHARCGWPLDLLIEIAPLVDAIEAANARVIKNATNDEALQFAIDHNLPFTAGSDAHDPYEIGRMALDIPEFCDSDSLRKVIRDGRVIGRKSPPWVHLFSIQARIAKRMNPDAYRDKYSDSPHFLDGKGE